MIKNCLVCGKEFYTKPARVKNGRGKYCSKDHSDFAHRGKPNGRKGIKTGIVPINAFKRGEHANPQTEFKKGQNIGKDNHNWKDEGFTTVALHLWVKRQLGEPKKCVFCESTKFVQWANKSELYLRDTTDWMELCAKCHKKYDNDMHQKLGIKSFRKRRFING